MLGTISQLTYVALTYPHNVDEDSLSSSSGHETALHVQVENPVVNNDTSVNVGNVYCYI